MYSKLGYVKWMKYNKNYIIIILSNFIFISKNYTLIVKKSISNQKGLYRKNLTFGKIVENFKLV